MPSFGICGPISNTPAAKAAGWDYLEATVVGLLQGDTDDAAWTGPALMRESALPIPVANVFLPGDLKIVGDAVDMARCERYLSRVLPRAAKIGLQAIVFGSGVARKIPEGFEVARAKQQFIEFSTLAAQYAKASNILIVYEPLNRGETNLMNSVAEGADYVKAVSHPSVTCLVDSYHFWLEKEPLSSLESAMPIIRHVHVADEVNRDTPGTTGQSDYRAFFGVLKRHGYEGRISVEAPPFKPEQYASCLAFLKREWAAA
jgi:sugar phosphate isomerase/epimerase